MQRGEEGEFRIDELYIAAAKEFIESVASSITLIQVSGVYQISFDSLNLEALANALNVFFLLPCLLYTSPSPRD